MQFRGDDGVSLSIVRDDHPALPLIRGDSPNSLQASWFGTLLASVCLLFIPWSLVCVCKRESLFIRSMEVPGFHGSDADSPHLRSPLFVEGERNRPYLVLVWRSPPNRNGRRGGLARPAQGLGPDNASNRPSSASPP